MKAWTGGTRTLAIGAGAVLWAMTSPLAGAQAAAPPQAPAPAAPAAPPQGGPPQEPAAPPVTPAATAEALAAGAFNAESRGGDRYRLTVAGAQFTSKDAIERYMIWRASKFALDNRSPWFELIEQRARGDTVPELKPDPEGPRYSFRLAHWRPIWRVKLEGSNDWTSWSPFSGAPFPVKEGDKVAAYEVTADVVLHKGVMDGINPLSFAADAVSDFLLYQVTPAA